MGKLKGDPIFFLLYLVPYVTVYFFILLLFFYFYYFTLLTSR